MNECYQCGATAGEHPNGRCPVFQLPPQLEAAPQRVYQLVFFGHGSRQVWRTRDEAEANRDSFTRLIKAARPGWDGWPAAVDVVELEVVP
jgi:hypothetical protein